MRLTAPAMRAARRGSRPVATLTNCARTLLICPGCVELARDPQRLLIEHQRLSKLAGALGHHALEMLRTGAANLEAACGRSGGRLRNWLPSMLDKLHVQVPTRTGGDRTHGKLDYRAVSAGGAERFHSTGASVTRQPVVAGVAPATYLLLTALLFTVKSDSSGQSHTVRNPFRRCRSEVTLIVR